MKKIVASFKLAAKAIGLKLSEEETAKLETIENEEDMIPLFDKLSNHIPAFANEHKEAGRAEIYNAMDAKLGDKFDVLKGIIGEEKFNKIKSTQGIAKLGILADDLAEAYAEAKKARKEGNQEDGKAANEKIIELTKKIGELETNSKQAIEAKEKEITERYESKLMNEALFTKVASVKDIASEYNKEEIIRGVMIPKLMNLAKTKKLNLKRSEEGGFDLLDENGTPLVVDGKHYAIDDLLMEATKDYVRKSDGGGGGGGSHFDPGKGGSGGGSRSVSVADAWQADAMG
ncbi:hypothetical protein [Telluribacter humicola]|uniref:hypothetical protein n=1 Tax=Telluribacter humicola TaxID=1720261 RepID=UPI001A969369|nr:hypothetical protein [Telluribacter humicola]